MSIDNEPWFVAKDVADVLGYRNAPDICRNIDDFDISTQIVSSNQKGNPYVKIINESGLYTGILKSRRPEALMFKRWVTSEVLPSIRKHGMYATPKDPDSELNKTMNAHQVQLISEKHGRNYRLCFVKDY